MNSINLIGNRYGKLVVLSRDLPRGKCKQAFWRCQCDCGNTTVVKSYALRTGEIKSCGCARNFGHNRHCTRVEAIYRKLYGRLVSRTQRRRTKSISLGISFEHFCDIIKQPCHYCGLVGQTTTTDSKGRKTQLLSDTTLQHNGVDRLDSAKGYENGNVVSCCTNCNFAKNTMSVDEFRCWLERVYRHFINGESNYDSNVGS